MRTRCGVNSDLVHPRLTRAPPHDGCCSTLGLSLLTVCTYPLSPGGKWFRPPHPHNLHWNGSVWHCEHAQTFRPEPGIALLEDGEHPGRFSALFADTMSDGDNNPAAIPVTVPDVQGDGRWMSQHNRFVADTKDKEPDVLFVGDSLVQLLHQFEIWRQLFSPLHALNFGIGGDATQNILWRIQHGELENIKPKVIVLWVGTNNHGHTAEQVAGGIEAIIHLMIQQQPLAKIIVLGLLPRGKDPNQLRVKNAQVNELVKEMVKDVSNASYLDVDPGFVNSDGTISHNDMYDYLHLTRHAYSSVCQVIHARVQQLLAEAASDPPNPDI